MFIRNSSHLPSSLPPSLPPSLPFSLPHSLFPLYFPAGWQKTCTLAKNDTLSVTKSMCKKARPNAVVRLLKKGKLTNSSNSFWQSLTVPHCHMLSHSYLPPPPSFLFTLRFWTWVDSNRLPVTMFMCKKV